MTMAEVIELDPLDAGKVDNKYHADNYVDEKLDLLGVDSLFPPLPDLPSIKDIEANLQTLTTRH